MIDRFDRDYFNKWNNHYSINIERFMEKKKESNLEDLLNYKHNLDLQFLINESIKETRMKEEEQEKRVIKDTLEMYKIQEVKIYCIEIPTQKTLLFQKKKHLLRYIRNNYSYNEYIRYRNNIEEFIFDMKLEGWEQVEVFNKYMQFTKKCLDNKIVAVSNDIRLFELYLTISDYGFRCDLKQLDYFMFLDEKMNFREYVNVIEKIKLD